MSTAETLRSNTKECRKGIYCKFGKSICGEYTVEVDWDD